MSLIENKQQRLINFQDGRRLPNDDLRAIQRQLDNLTMLFAGWGPFVLTGCEVTVNANDNSLRDVAEGLVYINDHLIYVPGFTGLDLSSSLWMKEISSAQLAPRGYVLTGTTEDGLMEYRVDFAASQPSNEESIKFTESGAERTKASDLDLPYAVKELGNKDEKGQSKIVDIDTLPASPSGSGYKKLELQPYDKFISLVNNGNDPLQIDLIETFPKVWDGYELTFYITSSSIGVGLGTGSDTNIVRSASLTQYWDSSSSSNITDLTEDILEVNGSALDYASAAKLIKVVYYNGIWIVNSVQYLT